MTTDILQIANNQVCWLLVELELDKDKYEK
jgi:hypothetical protein